MNEIITKSKLIRDVAYRADVKINVADKVINQFIQAVKDNLKDDNAVVIQGFAAFKNVTRAARSGHNLQGEQIDIPEHRSVVCRISGKF